MFDRLDIQKEYAGNLSPYLDRFQMISYTPYKALFRCPICGDSQKNKYKRRGYLLEQNGTILFHCHNECGSMSFDTFLENHYNSLYKDYKFDIIREWKRGKGIAPKVKEEAKQLPIGNLDGLLPAKKFPLLIQRGLPDDDIYFAPDFFSYINGIIPDKFPGKEPEARLVIPLRRRDGSLYGVTGRAIKESKNAKYLTVKFDEDHPKIWGLDQVDYNKHIYIVEGPFDAMLLPNAVAMLGTDGHPEGLFDMKNATIILDNQPRAENVISKYIKYINMGYSIVIWPDNVIEKDINDMILAGLNPIEIISNNTYRDLKAKLRLKEWKRI